MTSTSKIIVDKKTGCWVWRKPNKHLGYGSIGIDGIRQYVHRISYLLFNGAIPKGKEIDHLCRNRACINPTHLEVVTHKENGLRGISPPAINARKQLCSNGHPFSKTDSRGYRICNICHADRNQKSVARCKARRVL